MKKAVTISIAQTLFTIEEDAYQTLDQYLKSIRDHFAHSKDHDEITEDIEARISEKFLETKKKIITIKEVNAVIESMGKVEDFDKDEENDEVVDVQTAGQKKLYRNSKDKIIAGVCSGLAAYMNVDALWIRIVFVLLTIVTTGIWIIVYIVLALIIPEAKTTSQALEMKGTPVNLETMSENIKGKVVDIRDKHGSTIKRVLAWPFVLLKNIVDFLIAFLGPIIRVLAGTFILVMTLGGIILISIFTGLLLTNGESYLELPLTQILSAPIFYLATISAYLFLLLPLILIFILSVSLIRRKNMITMKLGLTFLFVWCGSVVGASVGGVSAASSFEEYLRTHELFEKTTKEIEITVEDLKSFEVTGNIRLKLVQGPETKLTLTGREKQLSFLKVDQTMQDTLSLYLPYSVFCFLCDYESLEGTLTVPNLENLHVYDQASITIDQWKSQTGMKINFFDSAHGNLTLEAPQLQIMAHDSIYLTLDLNTPEAIFYSNNNSNVEVKGTVLKADITAENSTIMNLHAVQINEAKANALNNSTINLPVLKKLEAFADNWSTISFKESPLLDPNSDNFKVQSLNGSVVNVNTLIDQERQRIYEEQNGSYNEYEDQNDDYNEYDQDEIYQEEPTDQDEIMQDQSASEGTNAEEDPVDTPADSASEEVMLDNAPATVEAQGTFSPF